MRNSSFFIIRMRVAAIGACMACLSLFAQTSGLAATSTSEWARALLVVPARQKAALQKLVDGMPSRDKQQLTADYLLRNTALAFEAQETAPWGATIPEDVFVNYVLPYSVIGEDVDDWRDDFRKRFLPVVEGIQQPAEAAQKINTVLWKMLDVVYSPKRDKPDQSPYHSMRIKMASCTGLSILLVDACRAVGIPARLVGCLWAHKPGNHSWVEVWQQGTWYHLGAFDGAGLNDAWFNNDVIYNKPLDPHHAIVAFAWLPAEGGGTRNLTSGRLTPRPVVDVTQRYLDLFAKTNQFRVMVVVRDAQGKRVAREVALVQGTNVLATGRTYDDAQDLNSHFSFTAAKGVSAQVQVRYPDGKDGQRRVVTFGDDPPPLCVFIEK